MIAGCVAKIKEACFKDSDNSNILWHTPQAKEPGITTERLVTAKGEPAKPGERAYDRHTGRLSQVGLSQQVEMHIPDNSFMQKKSASKLGGFLWPTPNTVDHHNNRSETIEAWEQRAEEKKQQGISLQFALRHAVQKSDPECEGWLSPDWVELLMGFPERWTGIEEYASNKLSLVINQATN